MKLKPTYALLVFFFITGISTLYAQLTFDTKISPVFEAYRLSLAGESEGKYYVAYNDKMMQYKEGVLARLSPSLTIEKKGSYEAPEGKYTGLGYASIKDKNLQLYFADVKIGGGLGVPGAYVLPAVIKYRKQSYNPSTLQPSGGTTDFYSEDADGFSAKMVYQKKSPSGKFDAVFLLPYKGYRTSKINLTENNVDVYNKKFDLSIPAPEASISEKSIAISNSGDIAFMVYDKSRKGDKGYIGIIPVGTKELKMVPLKGKPTYFDPVLTFNDKNELVVAYPYSNLTDSRLIHGYILARYSLALEEISKSDFTVTANMLEDCKAVKKTVKDGGLYDLMVTGIHQLANGNYALVCQQDFFFYNGKYDIRHSDFMFLLGFDKDFKPTYQHYIPKFQTRYSFYHYFGNSSLAVGNKVLIFHNAANAVNLPNEDSKPTFGCTWMEDGKGKPQTVALGQPLSGVVVTVADLHISSAGKAYFTMKTLDERKSGVVEVTINDK